MTTQYSGQWRKQEQGLSNPTLPFSAGIILPTLQSVLIVPEYGRDTRGRGHSFRWQH